jgi:hypothetical protein
MQQVASEGISEELMDDKHLHHRRGDFVALPVGVSFGGGQKVRLLSLDSFYRMNDEAMVCVQKPGNLVHPKERERLIRKLKACLGIIRIMGFQSSAYLPLHRVSLLDPYRSP